ncbi:ABC transporter substrate-binding protein [Scrofimicrobium sp. R131]|uniref:ABC transporter substrate-binding protein n=1 Tax=Scrofimicrobium appendicitidis TaxID=3079930 RepID=A0AAU7V8A5_9ACTO
MTKKLSYLAVPAVAALAALTLASCATANPAQSGTQSAPEANSDTSATDGAEHTKYPLTLQNCGEDVTFDQAPSRVVLLESAPVTGLDGIGVLDRVISLAGNFPPEYYSKEIQDQLAQIPLLSDDLNASGHLQISQEVVIAQEPDLVMGMPDGITRAGMKDAGANVLVQNVFCEGNQQPATWDTLYDQLKEYGQVFDRNAEADELIASLKDRVAQMEAKTKDAPPRTAAVLYPSIGGGPVYTYGTLSMAEPQLEAAGFKNVFDDVNERVFEVSAEELIERNPDVLILLYQGDLAGIKEEVVNLPGISAVNAVKNDAILPLLFNFTEPATPLTVDGLEQIVERFGTGIPGAQSN